MTLESGFVYLDQAVPGVRWDAKYATWDNFTGRPVDGYAANRVVVSSAMADALGRASDRARDRGFGLLVWDAYRPQRAVDGFLRWSERAEDERTKLHFYPRIARSEMVSLGYVAPRSGHSRGSAADLTLYRTDGGELLPMGGGHDLMDETSHHGANGVGIDAAWNRWMLRSIMEASGFVPFACEWWHYALRDEPFPDRYFDFPIG